jgi:hypothetical protein
MKATLIIAAAAIVAIRLVAVDAVLGVHMSDHYTWTQVIVHQVSTFILGGVLWAFFIKLIC